MNKEERYDLIERYLDGTLTDTERQEVERRLVTDPGFRAEVGLHRAMYASLGDTGNLRLRTALDNLRYDPPDNDGPTLPQTGPVPTSSPNWPRLISLIALLAVTGFLGWLWLGADNETTLPTSPEPTDNQPQDTVSSFKQPDLVLTPVQLKWLWLGADHGTTLPASPEPADNQPQDTVSPFKQPDLVLTPVQPNPNPPIAVADPADFVPNPVLEAKIGDIVRGTGVTFELSSPVSGASFLLQNGRVILPVRGVVTADSIPADQPLELLVYTNRRATWNNKQPIAAFQLPLTPTGAGTYLVDFRPVLRARPALYYLVAGQQRTKEEGGGHRTLWVGKFTVQADR